MTQTQQAGHTLAGLDAMSIEEAQALPFEERDWLLDLVIADGRHYATGSVSYRTGMYSDYFEEDFTRMLKVRAVKVYCRGTTPSNFEGVPVGENYEEQYRACLRHVEDDSYSRRHRLRSRHQAHRLPHQHVPVGRVQQGIPRVHYQPALQGCDRHHGLGPEAIGHRSRRMCRLPGG